VDYTFHQIITDASDEVIFNEVPQWWRPACAA